MAAPLISSASLLISPVQGLLDIPPSCIAVSVRTVIFGLTISLITTPLGFIIALVGREAGLTRRTILTLACLYICSLSTLVTAVTFFFMLRASGMLQAVLFSAESGRGFQFLHGKLAPVVATAYLLAPLAVILAEKSIAVLSTQYRPVAASLGASRFQTLMRVEAPILANVAFRIAILMFFLSSGMSVLVDVLGTPQQTLLPSYINTIVQSTGDWGAVARLGWPLGVFTLLGATLLADVNAVIGARQSNGRMTLPEARSIYSRVVVSLTILVLVIPLICLVVLSLSSNPNVGPTTGLTTDHYRTFLSSEKWVTAGLQSMATSAGAAFLATVLAVTLSITTSSSGKSTRMFVNASVILPLAYPALWYAFGTLQLLAATQLPELIMLEYAQIVIVFPLAYWIVDAGNGAIDRRLIEASSGLGATPIRTFTRIVLPLAINSYLLAFCVTFLVAINDATTPSIMLSDASRSIAAKSLQGLRSEIDSGAIVVAVLCGILLPGLLLLMFGGMKMCRNSRTAAQKVRLSVQPSYIA